MNISNIDYLILVPRAPITMLVVVSFSRTFKISSANRPLEDLEGSKRATFKKSARI